MSNKVWAAALFIALASPVVATASPVKSSGLTQPAASLTNPEAITAFGGSIFDCLLSRVGDRMIKDLPSAERAELQPATPDDRVWAGNKLPAASPVWVTKKLGYLLNIAEPSPERCEVHAIQLPVERTFRAVLGTFDKAFPDFHPVALEPGYNPIAYELQSSDHKTRYIIHMEGAEPGVPGHALRFSLLTGWVTRVNR